jgi:hypothetical protein
MGGQNTNLLGLPPNAFPSTIHGRSVDTSYVLSEYELAEVLLGKTSPQAIKE